jgi:Flp pilus assembly protein TadD
LPQLQKALQLDPNFNDARFQLVFALRALGRLEESREQLKIFTEAKQRDVKLNVAEVKGNQANADLQAGDAQKAVDLYREALADDPKNARTRYDLALALDRLGDYAGERVALQDAMKLDAKLAPVYNQLGFLQLKAGQTADAENNFKTAIALDPQYAEAQSNLGVLYGQQGREPEAERLFVEATENNTQYRQGFANLGLIQASQGRLPEAATTLARAVQLDANNTTVLTAYGMVLQRLEHLNEALAAFRKVAELQPKSPEAHLNLGSALADAQDWPQAIAQLKQAIEICGSCSVLPRLHKELGLIYYHSGDLKNGRTELLVAQQEAPEDEEVIRSLRLLEGSGKATK